MDVPELSGFNFQGGMTVSPEFSALLLGLVLYTAAFVAEIVRAGIQSVGRGQVEAAMAIGLRPGQVLQLVILPQALRVIIPPLTSQMLNLTKNSSLGHRHRLRRFCRGDQYHHQPDRAGDRRGGADHGRLSVLQPVDLLVYELVQQENGAGGEVSR